ncbi:aldehyde dehydrogenase domain-containing protein [Paraphysoderma sedebokerense]|nr:aldehyde dehydrogenase domain-containing protein [Paraphysoderma sedebokerense]
MSKAANLAKSVIKHVTPFIDNRFVTTNHLSKFNDESTSSAHPSELDPSHITIFNPYTSQPLAQVVNTSEKELQTAVEAAERGFQEWKQKSGKERRDVLLSIADSISRNVKDLAHLESLQCGKPINDSIWEVQDCVGTFKFYAGLADKMHGKYFNQDTGYIGVTMRKPIGICGIITSFNYPLLLLSWKLAPALAAGNSIIHKPPPFHPLSSLHFASIIKEHLPSGVFNVLPGHSHLGDLIVRHPKIKFISFTGSPFVGKKVATACANELKRCVVECGGKNCVVVDESVKDDEIEKIVDSVVNGAFANSGQNCCGIAKLYLHESIYEEFTARLKARTSLLRLGDPLDSSTEIGPMADKPQYHRVKSMIQKAISSGHQILCPPSTESSLKPNNSETFKEQQSLAINPTIFHDISEAAEIANEEIFGPVLCIMEPFNDLDNVIHKINDLKYGLAGAIFSNSISNIQKFENCVDTGYTWVNCYNLTTQYLPFGGTGRNLSGFGKDLGIESLDEWSYVKSVLRAE